MTPTTKKRKRPSEYAACRHCRVVCYLRCKGLCKTCHQDKSIRALYPNRRVYHGRPLQPGESVCRHCRKYAAAPHRRGLCHSCHRRRDVRQRYARYDHKWPRCIQCGEPRGINKGEHDRGAPCSICNRPPAEREVIRARVRLYERRVEMGLPLFGPGVVLATGA